MIYININVNYIYIYVNDIKKRIAFENLNDMNMVVFDVYDIFLYCD